MFSDIFTDVEERKETDVKQDTQVIKVKPAVDIYENEGSIVLLAEMPNVDKSDLKVQVTDGMLHISGTRKKEAVDGQYLIRETMDAVYERIFELEDDLDLDKISASYDKGILRVTLGKKEQVKPRTIEIK